MARRRFDVREIVGAIERATYDDLGQTAFAVARNLITRSPVGNPTLWQYPESAPPGYVGGHFRRNWQVTLGAPTDEELDGVDESGGVPLAQALAETRAFARNRRPASIFIQNNVPYANRLADGWSTQARAGWVDDEINRGLTEPGGTRVLD